MPKRTNPFQRLVLLIETALVRTGAKVHESDELIDRITGKRREVDIVIRHRVGHHDVVISVECTATGRPATVEWVEQQHCKHASLDTHKLILVSRGDFTVEARAKAERLGIDALSLAQATRIDWDAVILKMPSVTVASFLVPVVTHVTVLVGAPGTPQLLQGMDASALRDGYLIGPEQPDDNSGQTCLDYVTAIFGDAHFQKQVQQAIPADGEWEIDVEIPVRDGTRLNISDGRFLPVRALAVKARCKLERQTASLTKSAYGQAAVVHAASTAFGSPVDVVFAQQQGEQAGVVLRIGSRNEAENKK